ADARESHTIVAEDGWRVRLASCHACSGWCVVYPHPGWGGAASIRAASAPAGGSVELLAAREHLDELLDPARAGLRALRLLDPVQDRVAVLFRQRREELARRRVLRQRAIEVVRDLSGRGAVVRGVPAAVRLRALDFGEARRLHLPRGDQTGRRFAIDP